MIDVEIRERPLQALHSRLGDWGALDGQDSELLEPVKINQSRVRDSCVAYMLAPLEADRMTTRPVSTYVNNARNQGPECVAASAE